MLRKIGKKWYVQFQLRGRTLCRSTGETDKRKAQAKIAEVRRLVELESVRPSDTPNLHESIVREVSRVEFDLGERQAERVDCYLTRFSEWVESDIPLTKIDKSMLHNFQRHRLEKAAVETVRHEVCAIRRLLRENGILVPAPPPGRGRKTPNRAFTPDELNRLFAVTTPRYLAIYSTLLCTGARLAELVPSRRSYHKPLLKSEVDRDAGILQIRTAKCKPGETPMVRKVRIPEDTLDLLLAEMDIAPGPYAFRPLHKTARDFNACLKRAKIPKVDDLGRKATLHSFRHTYASQAALAVGGNVWLLPKMLGHKRVETSAHYCDPTPPEFTIALPIRTEDRTDPCKPPCKVIEMDFREEYKSRKISGG